MNKTLLTLFFLVSFLSISQIRKTYSKAKITYNTPQNLQKLLQVGIPIDHGQHKEGIFIISDFSNTEIEKAKRLGLQVDIIIQDLEADFIKKNKIAKTQKAKKNPTCPSGNGPTTEYPTPTNFALGSMGGYFTYQEMLDNLDAMHAKYPNLISPRNNVGNFLTNGTPDNSVSPSIGGNALQWVRISDNPNTDEDSEPEILYNSIHHAREPTSLSQLIYYMWYLLENYNSNDDVKQIVDNTELYFIPVVNPDGYLYNQKTNPNGGGFWRKNRFNTHGVDLNRNYDHYKDGTPSTAVWNTVGASSDVNTDIYAGTAAFSEVETQAMKWFMDQHNFIISMDNHSFGELLLMPYGFEANNPTPEGDIYQSISEELVSQNNYNNILITGLTIAAGGSIDYSYGGTTRPHNRVFGFGPEIGNDFWPASNEIDGICKNMMYMNLTAAKMTNNYAQAESTGSLFIGENTTFEAEFILKRFGLTGNGNFTVSIIPISSNIKNVENPKSYNNLQIGSNVNGKIAIDVIDSINIGDEISYTIQVDGGNIKESINVTKIYGVFDAVVNNNANSLSKYTHNGWSTTTSTFVSSTASITDSPNGNYAANQNKTIELTENINLEQASYANAQFYAKWDIENNWDYVQFEISTDNGASWIPQCGKHTNSGSGNPGQPTGEPLYDGSMPDWVLEEINLNDYLGKKIKMRFQLVSDEGTEADGFYFDDLKINAIYPSILHIPENSLSSFKIFPNPTEDNINILSSKKNYTIRIRSILGHEIDTKSNILNNYKFDFSPYPSGLYFITITHKGIENTFKIRKK